MGEISKIFIRKSMKNYNFRPIFLNFNENFVKDFSNFSRRFGKNVEDGICMAFPRAEPRAARDFIKK